MLVNATRWLEDCYGKGPDWKTAFAIAVHYVVLALSQMETDRGDAATDYLTLALRWNATKDQDLIELIDIGRATPAPPLEAAGRAGDLRSDSPAGKERNSHGSE